jgi:hypothetical protein
MIARKTIFSLVLALLIFGGIRARVAEHRDNCDRYMAGDRTVPASEYVEEGTRTVEVPCNAWLQRQPLWMQLVCMLDFAVIVVFVLNAVADILRWRRARRGVRVAF